MHILFGLLPESSGHVVCSLNRRPPHKLPWRWYDSFILAPPFYMVCTVIKCKTVWMKFPFPNCINNAFATVALQYWIFPSPYPIVIIEGLPKFFLISYVFCPLSRFLNYIHSINARLVHNEFWLMMIIGSCWHSAISSLWHHHRRLPSARTI